MPNILFILADDLGYGDVGCYNPKSKVPTPHLDQLALDGIRFTDAHSPSTVGTPTRYSIFTGRMAFRTGMKGVFVNIEDTIKGFTMIMDGEVDKYPEAAFNLKGTIEEVIEAGEKMLAEVS